MSVYGKLFKRWCLVNVLFSLSVVACYALHPFYEQNGDAYLLIGDGPQRGVYALNNLTTGSPTYLYDPLDAYGITANQVWNGDIIKFLYTFAGQDTGWTQVTGNISRRVKTVDGQGDRMNYPGEDTSTIISAFFHCGAGFNSPTGIGNHGPNDWVTVYCMLNPRLLGYDGCYPCFWLPTPDPARPGYCLVPVGKFYHSFVVSLAGTNPRHAWNRWAGRTWSSYPWMSRDMHWLIKERVEAKFRNLDLYEYNVSTRVGPRRMYNVAYVKLDERSWQDRINDCPDGCVQAQANIPGEAGEVPYVDCVYSARLNKAYLYRREPSSRNFTLTGVDRNSFLIGDPSDLTSKFIGISSRNNAGDYVYVLGENIINNWLQLANAPFRIRELTDVAVSDQWWMTGGIVYAYDKTVGMVYKFVRNETAASSTSIPEQIVVRRISVSDDGILPDSIAADGFGNLYMVKTTYEPVLNPTDFRPEHAVRWERIVMDRGFIYYRAHFQQAVYKSVLKRDYYSKSWSIVPGRILLGINNFFRDFIASDPNDRRTWIWIGSLVRTGVPVQTNYRTELAVINTCTPPRPGRKDGICDVNGLMVSTPSGLRLINPDSDGMYPDNQTYFLAVENAPYYDANGINIGRTGQDVDNDGRIGDFPSTINGRTVEYHWRLIQLTDRFGQSLNPPRVVLDQVSSSPVLPMRLGGGTYNGGVRVRFRFYDYDRLPLGALADSRDLVLSELITARGEDENNYSWASFTIKTIPPILTPEGAGVIMSGMPTGVNVYSFRPRPGEIVDNRPFVIPQIANDWRFRLRENNNNLARSVDRISTMLQPTPPDPRDPRMVTGSLRWTSNPKFTWTTTLMRNTEGLVNREIVTESPEITYSQVRSLFPIPSQPQPYTLNVTGERTYEFVTFVPQTIVVGGEIITNYIQTTIYQTISISAQCQVIVKDQTGPMLSFQDPFSNQSVSGIRFSTGVLYGTTGETLQNVIQPPTQNPANISIIVVDDNPFAGISNQYNNYQDPYHGTATPGCRITHNPGLRKATFFHETVRIGTIPSNNLSVTDDYDPLRLSYSSGPGGRMGMIEVDRRYFEQNAAANPWIGSYNKAFSYMLYTINLSDIRHFTSRVENDRDAEMEITYANNSQSYRNLLYGLAWRESSGLATSTYWFGQIVIRDNDRPNLYIEAIDLKNEGVIFNSPSNLRLDNTWIHYAKFTGILEEFNGEERWFGNSLRGFHTNYKLDVSRDVSAELVANGNNQALFEVDVPIIIKVVANDNAGSTRINFIRVLDEDGSSEIVRETATNTVRVLFRNPNSQGNSYYVEAEVEDDARGWPTNINDPFNSAPERRNKRFLRAHFRVYRTKLDVRVIEQNREGR